MSQEPPTVGAAESQVDKSAMTTGEPEPAVGQGLDKSPTSPKLDDDSQVALSLEAEAKKAQDAPAPRPVVFKTLMGISIEGLNLPGIRPSAKADLETAPAEHGTNGTLPESPVSKDASKLPEIVEARVASPHPGDEREVTGLLDEVAQALNVQASEYRDRARGRLPGMPTVASAPGAGANANSNSNAAVGQAQAEFEDPDDDGAVLTPAVISVVDGTEDEILVGTDASDEATVATGSVQAPGVPPGHAATTKPFDSKSTKVPPVPGMGFASSSPLQPVGPPPGVAAARPTTPGAGLALPSSGRVRLPSPVPGMSVPGLPGPSGGRATLPPGTMSPFTGARLSSHDLTATSPSTPISLGSARRPSGAVSVSTGRRSGRASTTRGNARPTDPVGRPAARSPLPAILTAHVRLATVNLAGLVALTFAGGLLVGMLVWRGQGRNERIEPVPSPRTMTSIPSSASVVAEPVVEVAKPAVVPSSGTAPAAQPPVVVPTPAATAAVVVGAAVLGATAASPAAAAGPAAGSTPRAPGAKDSVVAPLPPKSEVLDSTAETTGVLNGGKVAATATLRLPRPRRPVTVTPGDVGAPSGSTPVASVKTAPVSPPAMTTKSPAALPPAAAAATKTAPGAVAKAAVSPPAVTAKSPAAPPPAVTATATKTAPGAVAKAAVSPPAVTAKSPAAPPPAATATATKTAPGAVAKAAVSPPAMTAKSPAAPPAATATKTAPGAVARAAVSPTAMTAKSPAAPPPAPAAATIKTVGGPPPPARSPAAPTAKPIATDAVAAKAATKAKAKAAWHDPFAD